MRDRVRLGGRVDAVIITTFNYNKECRGNDLTPMLMAALRHEGLGSGGSSHGHESWRRELAQRPEHAQRELEATNPVNDPYKVAESMVRNSSRDLRNRLFPPINQAADRIAAKAGDHNVVKQNFGSLNNQGEYCGDIWIYWTDVSPAAYLSTGFCDDI